MLKRTYVAARKVEALIASKTKKSGLELYSMPHKNGREKGFQISNFCTNKSVFIYEHRNSDSICLTETDNVCDWSYVTEEQCDNTLHLTGWQYEKAADLTIKILTRINGGLK